MLALMDTTSPAHGPAPSPPPPTRAVDPNAPEHNERHPARPHTPHPRRPALAAHHLPGRLHRHRPDPLRRLGHRPHPLHRLPPPRPDPARHSADPGHLPRRTHPGRRTRPGHRPRLRPGSPHLHRRPHHRHPLLVLAWPLATYALFLAVPRLRKHWTGRPHPRPPPGGHGHWP
ncbi:hypothetical protein ACFQX6_63025 [Streptosporangium lutulentum]